MGGLVGPSGAPLSSVTPTTLVNTEGQPVASEQTMAEVREQALKMLSETLDLEDPAALTATCRVALLLRGQVMATLAAHPHANVDLNEANIANAQVAMFVTMFITDVIELGFRAGIVKQGEADGGTAG